MSRLMKLFIGVVALAAATSVLNAQVNVTVHLRNGESVQASLVDLNAGGFEVRVGANTRMIPKDQVAWVDFGGSVNIPASSLSAISGSNHLIVMKNGDTMVGNWDDVGGTTPLRLSFMTPNGNRDLTSNDVARIYMVRPDTAGAGSPIGGVDVNRGGMQSDGSVAVMANQPWTDTSINVRAGEMLRFEVSRTIRFGTGERDEATADGNVEGPARALLRSIPVRSMPVGGLIGRVANSQPFAIGTAPQPIRMPVNGRLWLGINDLSFNDNSGYFRVVVTR